MVEEWALHLHRGLKNCSSLSAEHVHNRLTMFVLSHVRRKVPRWSRAPEDKWLDNQVHVSKQGPDSLFVKLANNIKIHI